ncbi:dihydrodipicolinate synthase family protein [Egibacter rhizosphaerae]|uniref:Dihydrodipicolinate synthase family protein n=1 Tax=Egibacter rhizosphaerae TaxID=1670831 RepID=A0A411YC24_9ACTN|nr:dihydrodipicolinate synthase family protein [Egibacter rhizosphaerae]QBI18803.1 dihydrodipicolinate synthase family protein [Egibacter rhizosphaerae]
MSTSVRLRRPDGSTYVRELHDPPVWPQPTRPIASRVAYAAVPVMAAPAGANALGATAELDWEATLAVRREIWAYGLGVAEAMDTAQRGMGLDWATTEELIRRSSAEAAAVGGRIAAGAGTDHLSGAATVGEVVAGYEHQLEVVERAGARPILMASRHLAALARGPGDYAEVYGKLLAQVRRPAILHWLGAPFDPALAGYWGSADLDEASEAFLEIVNAHADVVEGVKISLLDADREVALRERLPAGVAMYTGDDFNYPTLIRGDQRSYSDALLGIFAGIAPAASAALQALDAGDVEGFDAAFAPTVPLARHVFASPTYYYKTGLGFLAWLRGQQPGFTMVGGLQGGRSVPHLVRVLELADEAGLLPDPELAAARMGAFLDVAGVSR